jgi:hypothetical protein
LKIGRQCVFADILKSIALLLTRIINDPNNGSLMNDEIIQFSPPRAERRANISLNLRGGIGAQSALLFSQIA